VFNSEIPGEKLITHSTAKKSPQIVTKNTLAPTQSYEALC